MFYIEFIFLEFKIALLSSLLFALGLMIVLPFVLFYNDRKYKSIKANINDDILLNENVNMIIDGKIRNEYLIVSTKKLHIISRDKKPYIEKHISFDNVNRINLKDEYSLNIYIEATKFYNIKSIKCKEIYDILKDKKVLGYINY